MPDAVNVVVCERNAIYVNNTRITNRETKWGLRATLATFDCPPSEVVAECLSRGFVSHIRCIDTEPYLSVGRAALASTKIEDTPSHD